MNKRGFQLSFSMIFSIIIIIAIVGVAFYAIIYFINLGKCTDISLFYQNFQEEVDKAWNSEIVRENFVGNLPSGIESVCFGDLNSEGSGEEYEVLSDFFRTRANTFLYPPENACEQVHRKIQHIDISELGWHCFEVRSGKVTIPLEKGSFDSLVKVKERL